MRSPDGRWPRARDASADARLIWPTLEQKDKIVTIYTSEMD